MWAHPPMLYSCRRTDHHRTTHHIHIAYVRVAPCPHSSAHTTPESWSSSPPPWLPDRASHGPHGRIYNLPLAHTLPPRLPASNLILCHATRASYPTPPLPLLCVGAIHGRAGASPPLPRLLPPRPPRLQVWKGSLARSAFLARVI